ncbi:hypothetical protein HDU93_009578, partial [Gonapodya sp. JEL0774]
MDPGAPNATVSTAITAHQNRQPGYFHEQFLAAILDATRNQEVIVIDDTAEQLAAPHLEDRQVPPQAITRTANNGNPVNEHPINDSQSARNRYLASRGAAGHIPRPRTAVVSIAPVRLSTRLVINQPSALLPDMEVEPTEAYLSEEQLQEAYSGLSTQDNSMGDTMMATTPFKLDERFHCAICKNVPLKYYMLADQPLGTTSALLAAKARKALALKQKSTRKTLHDLFAADLGPPGTRVFDNGLTCNLCLFFLEVAALSGGVETAMTRTMLGENSRTIPPESELYLSDAPGIKFSQGNDFIYANFSSTT